MIRQINLLPWRLKRYRRRSRILLWKCLTLVFTLVVLASVLSHFNRRLSAELHTRQNEVAQLLDNLRHVERQISQLQKDHVEQESYSLIATADVIGVLEFLSQLPMLRGELTEFVLLAEQLTLAGLAEEQGEFERINEFLTDNSLIKRVILDKFVPYRDGSLQFRFTLMLKEEKE